MITTAFTTIKWWLMWYNYCWWSIDGCHANYYWSIVLSSLLHFPFLSVSFSVRGYLLPGGSGLGDQRDGPRSAHPAHYAMRRCCRKQVMDCWRQWAKLADEFHIMMGPLDSYWSWLGMHSKSWVVTHVHIEWVVMVHHVGGQWFISSCKDLPTLGLIFEQHGGFWSQGVQFILWSKQFAVSATRVILSQWRFQGGLWAC